MGGFQWISVDFFWCQGYIPGHHQISFHYIFSWFGHFLSYFDRTNTSMKMQRCPSANLQLVSQLRRLSQSISQFALPDYSALIYEINERFFYFINRLMITVFIEFFTFLHGQAQNFSVTPRIFLHYSWILLAGNVAHDYNVVLLKRGFHQF